MLTGLPQQVESLVVVEEMAVLRVTQVLVTDVASQRVVAAVHQLVVVPSAKGGHSVSP